MKKILTYTQLNEKLDSDRVRSIAETCAPKLEPAYYGFVYPDKVFTQAEIDAELAEDGETFDPRYPISDRQDHPLNSQCRYGAANVAAALLYVGLPATVCAGWYLDAGRGYYAEPSMNSSSKPAELKKYNAKEHWWVETGDLIVDTTAAQFYPHSPEKQLSHHVVVVPINDAKDLYHAVKRYPK